MMPIVEDLVIGLAIGQVAVLVVSIYFHRCLAHESIRLIEPLRVGFVVLSWLLTGSHQRKWVALHRIHHANPDREGDPHSPHLIGFWRLLLGDKRLYRAMGRDRALVDAAAPDILIHPRGSPFAHLWLGPGLVLALLCISLGVLNGILAFAAFAISSKLLGHALAAIGHMYGGQPHRNTAHNSRWLALFTFGEGLHNNHHARVRCPKFSERRWDPDLGWMVIAGMQRLNWLVVLYSPTRLVDQPQA
jgi:stearoyl-CoA desaturase (delta-9 desaturase)